jgi:hypothetical protein
MTKISTKIFGATLILLLFSSSISVATAQTASRKSTFGKIQMLIPNGESTRETDVEVSFENESLQILAARDGAVLKTFKYSEIKSAEYSYTKNPRWKTGLGLGAASVVFPPLILVALPLGFTKHRRHWLSIRTENDYAVLKLSKSVRKIFIPAFETHTAVDIEAVGENK